MSGTRSLRLPDCSNPNCHRRGCASSTLLSYILHCAQLLCCRQTRTSASADMDLAQQPKDEYLGPRGTLDYFTCKKTGVRIACYYWPSEQEVPKAVIHFVHGHGSYLPFDALKTVTPGRFSTYPGSWVQWLNKAGYSVCGVDNQGAGRSGSVSNARCYCNSFDDYIETVVEHIQLVPSLNLAGFPPNRGSNTVEKETAEAVQLGVPRFLLGLSMGACTCALVGMRLAASGEVAGTVLLAPMLSLEKLAKRGINKLLRHIAPIVSGLAPKWKCVKVSRNVLYPDLQAAYDQDPNCWHENTRARNGYEYSRVTSWLMNEGGMEQVTLPFLVMHGEQDDMCDPDGSKALFARAQSKDKTFKLLNHMWHVLTKEPGTEGVLADIIEWLDARAASDTDSNIQVLAELRAAAAADLARSKVATNLVVANSTIQDESCSGSTEAMKVVKEISTAPELVTNGVPAAATMDLGAAPMLVTAAKV